MEDRLDRQDRQGDRQLDPSPRTLLLGIVVFAGLLLVAFSPASHPLLAPAVLALGFSGAFASPIAHRLRGLGQAITRSPRYAVIIGAGARAQAVLSIIENANATRPMRRRLPVVVAQEDQPQWLPDGTAWKRSLSFLKQADPKEITEVVIAVDDRRRQLPLELLVSLRVSGVRVVDALDFIEQHAKKIPPQFARPADLVFSKGFVRTNSWLFAKRVLDVAVSLLLLVLLSPVIAIIAFLVWAESGRPILYRQERVGLGGRTFEIIKFRSMIQNAEEETGPRMAVVGDPRITWVGRLLRRYRLDELPQLINILRGDMSFVGPRPERPVFVRRFERSVPWYSLRHSIRPGLTGWAQVQSGYSSDEQETAEKLGFDLYYLKHASLWLDLWVILRTVVVVVSGNGAR